MKRIIFQNLLRNLPRSLRALMIEANNWEGVKLKTHQTKGIKVCFFNRPFAFLFPNQQVHIYFPTRIKAQLQREKSYDFKTNLVSTEWLTTFVETASDMEQALWLLRFSYWLRVETLLKKSAPNAYVLKSLTNKDVQEGFFQLQLSKEMRNLLETELVNQY